MAIQNRRGAYVDFDKSKMVAGEIAVVQSGDPEADDGRGVYVSFQNGTAKRLAAHDELESYIDQQLSTIKDAIMADIRVISQTSDSELQAGDYVMVDSNSEGTRKFDLGTALTDIKEDLSQIDGISEDVKVTLLACFEHVAWTGDDPTGQSYIDALEEALYPPANLVSISAAYTQSGDVYDNQTLDSLRSDLVVTARYDDSSTQTVTSYTLSGTLATGTSTITVAYGGKTATFNVTVTHAVAQYTITNTLTHCTNSNSATVINEETAYSGTLAATSGYIMSTVTITMGGTDITSTAYNSETGAISIASVTGNVVITAEAIEDVGWISGQAYTVDWGEGGYILDSTGAVTTSSNATDHVSDFLPCHNASAVVCSTRPYDNYACFYDAEYTFLMRASLQTGIENPFPIPVPRNAYYIRVRERSATPNTISVTPYLYPTLSEGTAVELNTHYVMAYESGTESESTVSLMGSCNGATKFNTSLFARSFINFYDSSKTLLSTTNRQGTTTDIDIPSGAYYLTLNPNGYTANVNNPWIKFTA